MEIIIDKRVELMAVIQTLDNYWDELYLKFTNKKSFRCKYKENIDNYFINFKNHKAIKSYHELCNNIQDISFFINLVLCYSDLPKLNNIACLEKNLKYLFEPEFPYERFINEIKQFYEDTNFEFFFESNQSEYKKMLNDYDNKGEVEKYVNAIDDYLENETKNYTIIISTLTMGNFGIGILTNKNIKFNYSVLSPYDYIDNKYCFGSKNITIEMIFHEISHLTINDLTKKYINKFNICRKTIPECFIKQFYTDIETIINEYIIRAITIRLFEISHEEKYCKYLLQDNIQKGFKKIKEVKNYILENCERNNKFIKDMKYMELMNYVINII